MAASGLGAFAVPGARIRGCRRILRVEFFGIFSHADLNGVVQILLVKMVVAMI